jgi:circadian clock protein KaiC
LVVIDPISNLQDAGTLKDSTLMLIRMIDHLKEKQITGVFTNLTSGGNAVEATDAGISSIIDTWLLLRDIELGGERNRGIYVLKSRGTAHSNQIREFVMTDEGIELRDVYLGPDGVLTGSMRAAQEAREQSAATKRQADVESRRRAAERRRKALEAQIASLQAELEAEEVGSSEDLIGEAELEERIKSDRARMAVNRKADARVDDSKKSARSAGRS